jgi:putative MATE family efflux protein
MSTESLESTIYPGFWPTVREALSGSHRGAYTEGPIGRAILLLAVPMVLELVLESVFAVVDVFFVSRLGPDAVATVGLTESMITIIYAVAIGLSVGAMATVARRIGERDQDGAARAAVQAIALGLLVSIPLGVLGAGLAPSLLTLMGATPDVLVHSSFTAIMLGANGVIVMLFVINAVFRGAGDAAIAMRVLWIANVFNICLDPCLIFGLGPFPRLGVTGAAVATTSGRGIGVLVQLFVLTRGQARDSTARIAIRPAHLRPDPRVMMSMLRLSGSAMFQTLVATTSWVGIVRLLATFGSVAVAGSTIAIRIVIFVLLPSWGLSNAAATLVGQNLGAGKPDRAEASVWRAAFFNMVFLTIIGVLFATFADVIVGAFTQDPEVLPIATSGLRIISAGFPFYAYGYVLTQAFNGAGDTATPTWINIGCLWLGEIPLGYALALGAGLGPSGAFWAVAIAFSVMSAVSALLFRRGRWKLKRV